MILVLTFGLQVKTNTGFDKTHSLEGKTFELCQPVKFFQNLFDLVGWTMPGLFEYICIPYRQRRPFGLAILRQLVGIVRDLPPAKLSKLRKNLFGQSDIRSR